MEAFTMSTLTEISQAIQTGKMKLIKELVPKAIEEGCSAQSILNEGLLHGMNIVGDRFTRNEAFVPEVLVAARAMNKGIELIKPLLAEEGKDLLKCLLAVSLCAVSVQVSCPFKILLCLYSWVVKAPSVFELRVFSLIGVCVCLACLSGLHLQPCSHLGEAAQGC